MRKKFNLEKILKNKNYFMLLIFVAITLVLTFYIKDLKFDSNVGKLIPQDPKLKDIYNNENNKLSIILIFKTKNGIFNKDVFNKIQDTENNVLKIFQIESKSLNNIFSYYPQLKKDFYEDEDIAILKERVESSNFIKKLLVNKDETLMFSIILLSDDYKKDEEKHFNEKIKKTEELLKEYSDDNLEILITGDLYIRDKILNYMGEDFKILGPVAAITVILALYLLTKSIFGAIIPILIALLSIIWTFGLKGLLGSPITVPETPMAVILISIGCADGVHIINETLKHLNNGKLTKEKMREIMKKLMVPIFLTSITTAFGFLSLLTSSINAYKSMGIFMAIGVLFAMIFSIYLIPQILLKLPLKYKKTRRIRILDKLVKVNLRIVNFLIKHKWTSLLSVVLVLIISTVSLLKVEINFDEIEYFKEKTQVKKTFKLMQSEFGGLSVFNVVLKGESGTFKNYEVIKEIDKMSQKFEEIGEKTQGMSLINIIKLINFNLKQDSDGEYKLPENKFVLNQVLNLIKRSSSMKEVKNIYVNKDWSEFKILLRTEDSSSKGIKEFANKVELILQEDFPEMNYYFSGSYNKINISSTMIKDQIYNILTTLIAITFILMLCYKSLRTGLIISIPIAWSVFLNFALMYLLDITLNPATATIASVGMGIGVDYAIHYFSSFRRYFRESNDYKEAILSAISSVFNGIISNSLAVSLGFFTLFFSNYQIIATLGYIISFTMITTAITSLTILPLLIYVFKPSISSYNLN